MKLKYGNRQQVSFKNIDEYYYVLGFLANNQNAEVRWEHNEEQGAWGSEGRIHCLLPESQFPQCFRFTVGRGNVYARINCNEYVTKLVTEHRFNYNNRGQNLDNILETVPCKYRNTFMAGYESMTTTNPNYKPQIPPRTKSTKTTDQANNPKALGAIMPEPTKDVVQNLMPLKVKVGENLWHKVWGNGTVLETNGKYIKINFSSAGERTFLNPDAFRDGFLKK